MYCFSWSCALFFWAGGVSRMWKKTGKMLWVHAVDLPQKRYRSEAFFLRNLHPKKKLHVTDVFFFTSPTSKKESTSDLHPKKKVHTTYTNKQKMDPASLSLFLEGCVATLNPPHSGDGETAWVSHPI